VRMGRLGWSRRGFQRRMVGAVAVLAGVPLLSIGLTAGVASASGGGGVTIYPGIDGPGSITAGPNGALWFTNANGSIGQITTAGKARLYADTDIDSPAGITAGPDGALWFTNEGNNSIGRITTAGTVTIYTHVGLDEPEEITAGPDGALWFTSYYGNQVGRIATAVTPEISGFTPTSGAAGTSVTITGQNLSGATAVAFGGTAATIVSDTGTEIVTQVPAGAATGTITVTTPDGTATSHAIFSVTS
jgi:streptogramin lyase